MLLVGCHGNSSRGPTLPIAAELRVTMETSCVITSIRLAQVITCACVSVYVLLLTQKVMKIFKKKLVLNQ